MATTSDNYYFSPTYFATTNFATSIISQLFELIEQIGNSKVSELTFECYEDDLGSIADQSVRFKQCFPALAELPGELFK
jgi:hypothetical protein